MKFESDIIRFLQSNATTEWLAFFQIVTLFGSFLGLVITFVVLYFQNKKLCLPLLITFAAASVINHILKALIGRPRPFDSYVDIINYGGEDGFSMPSGHALCAGIYFFFLVYGLFKSTKNKLTRGLGVVAYASVVLIIAFSRMVLGVHYFTDVIVGVFLGIIFAIIGLIVYNVFIKMWTKKSQKE